VDVGAWLRGLGLEQYEQAFRENDIDAGLLTTLTADDLRELGVASLGHRKLLLAAIAALTGPADPQPSPAPAGPAPASMMPQAERRQLTVMFVDLVGSTALSTRLDPEDMREVLRVYQNTVTGEIARVDGHVAKLMGDGVLSYFGWPRAHEDDAERAARAGLAIGTAVGRLSTPAGEPLATRVGIATGLVVVGDLVGEGAAREEAVVGETPNLAARLQETASPGAVVIADGTRRLLGELFELLEFGPTRLKGFAQPVSGFQILGERTAGSRFEAQRSGRALPIVGRDQELALVLERWRQAVAGEGQAVLLVGEAGIGKSRLVQAMLDAVAVSENITLRYQCSPHHTGTALWPVIQQLGFAADLKPTDAEAVKLDKLEALLGQAADDVGEAVPLIAALLGTDAGVRYPARNLTPHQQRARTLAVLVEQLLGLARRRPVLMLVEDAHWIDPSTLEFVGQALDRIAGARVLMLLTSRPDSQPRLGGHSHVTRLMLNRLGRSPTEAIIARLTGGKALPAEVLEEIVSKTDGVPLFVEELTKAVLEAGAVGPGATVPISLHASLMARLDRVPDVKEVAQTAACIGREFSYRLLAEVSSSPEAELRGALDRLAAAELVFRRGVPPEASYTFKHALVRDAAHESLLRTHRQQLHARIVRALEDGFPETADTEPELLAQHCVEAGLAERAVDYWQQAGQQALARSAMAEAVAHLTRGLEVLKGLPDRPERQRRELGLQLALGQASIAAKGFAAPETGRAYVRARELCRDLGDVSELVSVLFGQAAAHWQRAELTAAREVARDLLRMAEERDDTAAQVVGHRLLGAFSFQLGRFAESRTHMEEVLALYDPVRDRNSRFVYSLDSRVVCLLWLSQALLVLGYPEQAQVWQGEVLATARELAHPNTIDLALFCDCSFHQLLRDRREAQEQAEALIVLATEQSFPLWLAAGVVVRGWALAAGGRAEDGIAEIRRGLADYRATGAELFSPYFLFLLADAHRRADQAATGLSLVAEALGGVERTGVRWIEAELHRLRGELLLALAEPEQAEAEACFNRALDVARKQGARMWELRAATSLARLWHETGRTGNARELLAPVYDWFTEGFDTADLKEARALLNELTSAPPNSPARSRRRSVAPVNNPG
jgi:class 3 adenylate cyclase/predicted ATPase